MNNFILNQKYLQFDVFIITFDTEAGDITDMDLRPLFVPFCVAESSLIAPRTLFSLSLAAATIANVLQIIINAN